MHFIPNGVNEILQCEDFFISYNPGTVRNPLDDIGVMIGAMRVENLDRPETALVIKDSDKLSGQSHYILYGDYREAYATIAHRGLDACIAFFMKHIEHIADTSNRPKTINH